MSTLSGCGKRAELVWACCAGGRKLEKNGGVVVGRGRRCTVVEVAFVGLLRAGTGKLANYVRLSPWGEDRRICSNFTIDQR